MKEGRKKKRNVGIVLSAAFYPLILLELFLCCCAYVLVLFIYIHTFFFRRLFREVSFFSSYICNACHASSELIIAVFLCETSTASKEGKRGQTARQGCRFTPVVSHHRLINPCSTHIICRYTHTHKKKKKRFSFFPSARSNQRKDHYSKKKEEHLFFLFSQVKLTEVESCSSTYSLYCSHSFFSFFSKHQQELSANLFCGAAML